MADENYRKDALIGKYIRLCEARGAPLNEVQISALEKAIIESCGVREPDREARESDLRHFGLIEFRKRAAELGFKSNSATIVYFAVEQKKFREGLDINDISNQDLLRLYNLFGEIKPHEVYHAGIPHFGQRSYKLLQTYLESQGLIQVTKQEKQEEGGGHSLAE